MSAKTAMNHPHGVAVGQVWVDTDPRIVDYRGTRRYGEVLSVSPPTALVQWFQYQSVPGTKKRHRVNGRRTNVRLDRFKPTMTGYKRVS